MFVVVRLRVEVDVDDIRLVLKLPAEGLLIRWAAQVLRTSIDSPERVLAFLRALLGGLDGLADWMTNDGRRTVDAAVVRKPAAHEPAEGPTNGVV